MLKRLRTSIKSKILAAFVILGLLPYLSVMAYFSYWGERQIGDDVTQTLLIQNANSAHEIERHFDALQKDVRFLARLDLMDDILANDIDRRIARLLEQQRRDYDVDLHLHVLDTEGRVVSSSSAPDIDTAYAPFSKIRGLGDAGYAVETHRILLFAPLQASFDEGRLLGYLVVEYPVANLDRFNTHQERLDSTIVNTKLGIAVGRPISYADALQRAEGVLDRKSELVTFHAIEGVLEGFYLVYRIEKAAALSFVNDFLLFMGLLLLVGVMLISLFAWWFSDRLLRPVLELSKVADGIIETQDYGKRVEVKTDDEIGSLASSFNHLVGKTKSALEALEFENRVRLLRFVRLIQIFNHIIQTQNEQECMETSLQEVRKLTGRGEIRFIDAPTHRPEGYDVVELSLNSIEDGSSESYGALLFEAGALEEESERQFYESIGRMIMLQIERIRLFSQTMAASEAKSAFISNMSHELRTPLNAIIGFSQYLIVYEELNDETKETVGSIEKSAQHLLGMINEILDMAKIEAGKITVYPAPSDPVSLCDECTMMLSPLAEEKGLQLHYVHEDYPGGDLLNTDPQRFKQVVINLLSNAIKFTESGSIVLHLAREGEQAVVEVRDTGIGIAPEHQAELFQEFTQIDNVLQKKHKGSGLGLALSRKLAHLLGGELTLHSEGEGKGSVARFTLRGL